MSYTSPATRERETLEFAPISAATASTSVVRTLAAKHRISELAQKESDAFRTEKDKYKAEIEALGVKYAAIPPPHLLSPRPLALV